MTRRAKVDPRFLHEIESWEGTPLIGWPANYQSWLRAEFCPHFHICAYGPVPMGQTERTHLIVDNLVVADAETAERFMWEYIEHMSDQWAGYEFDAEDWEIAHVLLGNGN